MALDQLSSDMPKASFDTWLRDPSFVSFEKGVFTIGPRIPMGESGCQAA